MILFLGDSFTWGQGLYFEKWKGEGKDIKSFIEKYEDVSYNPHENLDYDSHFFRKQHHFPSLVSKYFNKNYDIKWGNGGSNWDIIHQLNVLPILSPQFRNGLDLIVIQLTDWTRNDNRLIFKKDAYEQGAVYDFDILYGDKEWKEKLVYNLMEREYSIQLKKIKEILDYYEKRWICFSWRQDMGILLKNNYPEQYIPIYYNNKEVESFEQISEDSKYNLKEFNDGHFNIKGHQLIANSIIEKIKSLGGSELFNYLKIE